MCRVRLVVSPSAKIVSIGNGVIAQATDKGLKITEDITFNEK